MAVIGDTLRLCVLHQPPHLVRHHRLRVQLVHRNDRDIVEFGIVASHGACTVVSAERLAGRFAFFNEVLAACVLVGFVVSLLTRKTGLARHFVTLDIVFADLLALQGLWVGNCSPLGVLCLCLAGFHLDEFVQRNADIATHIFKLL